MSTLFHTAGPTALMTPARSDVIKPDVMSLSRSWPEMSPFFSLRDSLAASTKRGNAHIVRFYPDVSEPQGHMAVLGGGLRPGKRHSKGHIQPPGLVLDSPALGACRVSWSGTAPPCMPAVPTRGQPPSLGQF